MRSVGEAGRAARWRAVRHPAPGWKWLYTCPQKTLITTTTITIREPPSEIDKEEEEEEEEKGRVDGKDRRKEDESNK
ncbi:hypothetical protein E2C01_034644 [Portunus trituberculatus]|uniref:Uncharacterized protein n=1 Tax=Portunus trituberculatus TaxID=210409 RepID=A0A5B7F7K2_PORTR|nr:hypothetical protein [Portunus trituberculatus]